VCKTQVVAELGAVVAAKVSSEVLISTPPGARRVMEFLFEYLGFLARAVTIVVAIMVVLGFVFANATRRGGQANAQGRKEKAQG